MTADVVVLGAADARALTDRIKVGVEAVWQLITQAYTERAWTALGYESWDDYCTREFGTSRLRLPREERAEVVSSLRESGLSIRAIAAATGLNKETVNNVTRELSGNQTPDSDGYCDGKCATGECVCPVDEGDDDPAGELADAERFHPVEQQLPPLPENYMNVPGGEAAPPKPADAVDRVETEQSNVIGLDGKKYRPKQPAAPKPPSDRRRPLMDTARDLALDIDKIATRIEKLGADDRLVRNRNEVAPRLRHHLEQLIKVCQDLNDQLTQGV